MRTLRPIRRRGRLQAETLYFSWELARKRAASKSPIKSLKIAKKLKKCDCVLEPKTEGYDQTQFVWKVNWLPGQGYSAIPAILHQSLHRSNSRSWSFRDNMFHISHSSICMAICLWAMGTRHAEMHAPARHESSCEANCRPPSDLKRTGTPNAAKC